MYLRIYKTMWQSITETIFAIKNKNMKNTLTTIALLIPMISFAQDGLQPPDCKKVPKTDTIHSKVLTDNYYWLKERDNPDVLKYIKAENAYTESMMKPTKELQEQLYKEILSRIKQTDVSVPYKLRGYWYYSKTEEGKNYPIYCRKKESLENAEEVLLNVNEIIKEHKYYGVYGHNISPNNELMAYYVDKTGNFELDIFFRNLKTKIPISDILHSVTSLAWANDNRLCFMQYRTVLPIEVLKSINIF